MGAAIGQSLVVAVALILATLPTVLVTLVLETKRPGLVSNSFIGGWVVGLAVAGGVVIAVGDVVNLAGPPPGWLSYVEIALGALLLVLAIRKWRGRARSGDVPETPKWMASIDSMKPARAFGLAFLMASVNPKNLVIVASGATVIVDATSRPLEQLVALVLFVVVGSLGIAAPAILRQVFGERSAPALDAADRWMTRHSALVMSAVLLVLAVLLISNGISGL
jgi:threonine/homoserine/homoserine lactone efflux protein